MTSSPDPPLSMKIEEVIKKVAAWALLVKFLKEHPPTAKMNSARTRVLLKSESWIIALFLCLRAEPWSLCKLARALVGDDADRQKTARKALRDRYLPAFEAYELVQVTRADGGFVIAATDKLRAFFSDCYFPALASNKDEWLDDAA